MNKPVKSKQLELVAVDQGFPEDSSLVRDHSFVEQFEERPVKPAVNPKPNRPVEAPLAQSADPDDFDWATDESIVLHEQRATAVYRNTEGEVVIRQRRWPDDDAFLFVAPEQAVAFLEGMAEKLRE
jgi:hypothetical protein